MKSEFLTAITQLSSEKGVPREMVVEAIKAALVSAYKRNYDSPANDLTAEIEPDTGDVKVYHHPLVVEDFIDDHPEGIGDDDQLLYKDAVRIPAEERNGVEPVIGERLTIDVTPPTFGRIAAQTAKQVVVQRIREAEREKVYDEFAHRVGEVVTGVVQRREQRNAFVLLGKVEALLPYSEQVPGEPYRFNDRVKIYLLEVKRTAKGPQVIVSRSHPSLIRRLFELEVPEIEDGTVLIKSVAREPGARSKIAVATSDEKVDPVGACVGHRGSRVQAVVNELYGEKIDIIRWHDSPADFIREALSPAKAMSVTINEEAKSAYVVVPDTQLSLAIGKEGQNVRLAARLTGWRIDIRSDAEAPAAGAVTSSSAE